MPLTSKTPPDTFGGGFVHVFHVYFIPLELIFLPAEGRAALLQGSARRLTQRHGAEGHGLFLPAVVVEGQVPGARVQVAHEHRLVQDNRLDTAPLPGGLDHTPLLFAIQTLHVVILPKANAKRERERGGEKRKK